MSAAGIITAFTLSAFIIALWVAMAVRLHPYWANSRVHDAIHTAALWFIVEYRARQAARNHTTRRALRTTLTGTHHRAGHPDEPAVLAFAYRPADPYAVRLVTSTRDTITVHTFARDLLTQALNEGTAGEGRIRIHRNGRRTIGVTIDPAHLDQAHTYLIPQQPLADALRRWHLLVPTGTETLGLTTHIDAELATLLGESPRS